MYIRVEGQPCRFASPKWGNSLAVRLPRAIADDLGLDIAAENGSVMLKPTPGRVRLSDLVAEAERLGSAAHPEIVVWGGDVGAEIIKDAYSTPRGSPRRAKPR